MPARGRAPYKRSWRIAIVTAAVRSVTSSFAKMRSKCVLIVLPDDPDARAPGPPGGGRVRAEHADLAAVPFPVALRDLHRRALAGAVGPEEAEDLTLPDRQVQSVHCGDLAVLLA